MGWIWLALIGAGAFALMSFLGVARSLWSFVGAGLMLGAAGYALQARPDLRGHSAKKAVVVGEIDPDLSRIRLDMFGRYTIAEPYFAMSDALIRSGAKSSAVSALLGGVNSSRENAALWTALGEAYVAHDGSLSPPARFAFGRALQLAPEHPGPAFFFGVGLVREGQWVEARKWWSRAYRLSPPDAAYREEIGARLVMLDAAIKQQEGR